MAYQQQGYRPQTNYQYYQPAAQRGQAASGRGNTGRGRKKSKRGRPIKIFFLLVLFALIATVGVMGYMMYEEVGRVERMNTFYPGVYIDDVEMYGATPQEAYDFLLNRSKAGFDGWSINLTYNDNTWTITPDTIGINTSLQSVVQEEVNKAFFIGRSGSVIDRYKTILQLKTEPYQGYTSGIQKNMDQIDAIISEIQATVYVAPENASRAFDASRNNPVVIASEKNGQELDAAGLKSQIVAMVSNMEAGTIQVQPTTVTPEITEALLSTDVVLIGSYRSAINKNSTNERNMNIKRGCEAFNGKAVQPGEKVSFNSWVGTRTEKNGFYPAQEIVRGGYEMGVGGGICQVSTTLYQAVIRANLRVRDRTNHGIPVNYAELGDDATVSDGRIDFVFENNTGSPIYLVARLDEKNKECVFEIYGRPDPDGYTYSLRHEQLEEIPIPEPVYEKDKDGEHVFYTDEEYVSFKGAVGYKVRSFKVTKDSKGNIISEEEIGVDTYKAQAPFIYVGVNKRDEM